MNKIIFLLSVVLLAAGCSKDKSSENDDQGLKVLSETEISYDEFLEEYANNVRRQAPGLETDEMLSGVREMISERKERAEAEGDAGLLGIIKYTVSYQSKMPNGSPAMLSGAIFIDRWDYWNHNPQHGIVLANHYTIGANSEAPSAPDKWPYEVAMCARQYIVVMADYIGFGKTVGTPQAYLHAESTAQSVVDLFLQSRKFLAEDKFTRIGDNHYNIGYSQGGHTAMAVHKLVQEKYSDKIKFKKTIAGGGPYDIEAVYNEFVTTNKTGIPAAIPLIVVGMDFAEGLKLDYDKVFLKPLVDYYVDWVVSKNYNTTQITQMMGGEGLAVDKILHPDALDLNNAQTKKLLEAFRKNSLTRNWKPATTPLIHIFHSTEDDVVPVICARNMVNFVKTQSGVDPGVEIGTYGGHMRAGVSFYARCLLEQIPL